MFYQELDTRSVPPIWKGVDSPADNLTLPSYVPPEVIVEDSRTLLERKGVFPLSRRTNATSFIQQTWSFGKVKLGETEYSAHLYVRGIVQEPKILTENGIRVPMRFYTTTFPGDKIRTAVSKDEVDGWSGKETVVRIDFTPTEAALIQVSAIDMSNTKQRESTIEHVIYQAA